MTRNRQFRTIFLVGCMVIAPARWASPVAQSGQSALPGKPPIPSGASTNNPCQIFRELLAATDRERESILARKPEVHRKHLEERLKEFGSMPIPEREVRLRMMELRWFLVPLFAMPASNRVERLATVPDSTRKLVDDRLKEWDALPGGLRQEMLQHGITLQYFAGLETVSPKEQVKLWNTMGRESRPQPAMNADQWRALMVDRKRNVSTQLERFFELSADEKQRTLRAFSNNERKQVDNALRKFEQLPVLQRKQCLDSFQKYAEMSEKARGEFLKNVERWKAMSLGERKAWRSLITQLPPMPPGMEAASHPSNPDTWVGSDANR